MTTAVHNLLTAFDALSEAEKHEAAAALLQGILAAAPAHISDDSLAAAADAIFLELDAREAANGVS